MSQTPSFQMIFSGMTSIKLPFENYLKFSVLNLKVPPKFPHPKDPPYAKQWGQSWIVPRQVPNSQHWCNGKNADIQHLFCGFLHFFGDFQKWPARCEAKPHAWLAFMNANICCWGIGLLLQPRSNAPQNCLDGLRRLSYYILHNPFKCTHCKSICWTI